MIPKSEINPSNFYLCYDVKLQMPMICLSQYNNNEIILTVIEGKQLFLEYRNFNNIIIIEKIEEKIRLYEFKKQYPEYFI